MGDRLLDRGGRRHQADDNEAALDERTAEGQPQLVVHGRSDVDAYNLISPVAFTAMAMSTAIAMTRPPFGFS